MNPIQETVIGIILSFLDKSKIIYEITTENQSHGNSVRLDLKGINDHCTTTIFSNGNILNQGKPQSKLKEVMDQLKSQIEKNEANPDTLPFEIESFPQKLYEIIPTVDPVIVEYISEAIDCYKARAFLATAFLLGAASEKAIWVLIDSYINAITEADNQQALRTRVANKFI